MKKDKTAVPMPRRERFNLDELVFSARRTNKFLQVDTMQMEQNYFRKFIEECKLILSQIKIDLL